MSPVAHGRGLEQAAFPDHPYGLPVRSPVAHGRGLEHVVNIGSDGTRQVARRARAWIGTRRQYRCPLETRPSPVAHGRGLELWTIPAAFVAAASPVAHGRGLERHIVDHRYHRAQSPVAHGRGLERDGVVKKIGERKGRPSRTGVDWNSTPPIAPTSSARSSPVAHGRGLEPVLLLARFELGNVARRARAWIGTTTISTPCCRRRSSPVAHGRGLEPARSLAQPQAAESPVAHGRGLERVQKLRRPEPAQSPVAHGRGLERR